MKIPILCFCRMIVPWGITGPDIKKGIKLEEPNNTVNTAATILYLFKVKKPLPWVGEVPFSIFKRGKK